MGKPKKVCQLVRLPVAVRSGPPHGLYLRYHGSFSARPGAAWFFSLHVSTSLETDLFGVRAIVDNSLGQTFQECGGLLQFVHLEIPEHGFQFLILGWRRRGRP